MVNVPRTSYQSLLKRLEPPVAGPAPSCKIILPYENYLGAVIGGQFRLGRLVRRERLADIYEITSLFSPAEEAMEAAAYDLRGPDAKARKKDMSFRKPFVLCPIDQAGKKFLVYRVNEKREHERNMKRAKKKRSQEKRQQNPQAPPEGSAGNDHAQIPIQRGIPGVHGGFHDVSKGPINSKRPSVSAMRGNKGQEAAKRDTQKVAKQPKKKRHRSTTERKQANHKAPKHPGKQAATNPRQQGSPWEKTSFNLGFPEGGVAPKFKSLADLRKGIERLLETYGTTEADFNRRRLDELLLAKKTLERRSWLWVYLQQEFNVLRQVVDILDSHLDSNERMVDLNWEMRKRPGFELMYSSPPLSMSPKITNLVNSLRQPRWSSLERLVSQIIEDVDYDYAVYLRDLWAHTISRVRLGALDTWVDDIGKYYLHESLTGNYSHLTTVERLEEICGVGLT
ncbi:hypothetical protein ColTof3_08215 [Colletotrichum tofieldiae]|nr:hypothetical protein ColTof3_08215 [Colletotrichum tofieldiae]GKT90398.1 hypothetical protein Ct61P_08248 [Colletotrichum tofieldiae]